VLGPTAAGAHYFAVGHALSAGGAPNPVDFAEVSDMTIDCRMGFSTTSVACGAVRLFGNHVRLKRLKAINWGTRSDDQRCTAFSLITAIADPAIYETVDAGIEDCVAVQPYQHNRRDATALHIG